MMKFSHRNLFTRLPLAVTAILLTHMVVGSSNSHACFYHERDLVYSPTNCEARPDLDRVFRLQTITWRGQDYLFVDEGNEIKIMNIDDPINPVAVATSAFNIPNVGDSDYDLQNFTVCDDCRFGMANYKAATVLFDLGTGHIPVFVGASTSFDANLIQGGFTFRFDAQQYLVAAGLGNNTCFDGHGSALYQFTGIDETANPILECVDNGGAGAEIANGLSISGTYPPVIYMSERFDQFRIYQIRTVPVFGLDYLGTGGISRANMHRGYGVAVDESAGLMAVADSGDLDLYDIGWSAGSPASPILISSTALPTQPNANAVALRFPVVHVSQQYSTREPLTFDVSNPSTPVPLDQPFWDPGHPWNNLGPCVWNNHAVFSDDGAAMFLSRYSALQIIDPTGCYGPLTPVAAMNLDPQPAFPGDLVTVTNTSLYGDRYAAWITDGADPYGSSILAGSVAFTSDTELLFTLPADMADADVFYAHTAVETDGFPFVPGSTPDQISTHQIVVDRTPQASITITPPAAVTGDAVVLTAEFEGHPAVPGGGDPFAWIVTDPLGTPTGYTGSPVNGVVLHSSGQWQFELDVAYQHGGGTTAVAPPVFKDISSVAAAFDIAPSNPLYNEIITLTSHSAAVAGATLDFDWDVLAPGGQVVVHELAFCDGAGSIDDQCIIPAETLSWGTYDIRLTLVNTATGDQDVALVENFEILIDVAQVDFTWSPTQPEIGQWIVFHVTGIPGDDIEEAVWDFGSDGCDGVSRYYTCTPGPVPCDLAPFKYATSGPKTVMLTVTTTGGAQGSASRMLTVQDIGSCGGTCTYSISPSLRIFPDAGGSGDTTVITQGGCSWSAYTVHPWITLNQPTSGAGSGFVSYDVAINTGAARSGIISVAGKVHSVQQASADPCSQGSVPDDGSVENGYGWGAGKAFVQEFTPETYPFVFTDVCAAFTQAGGDTTLDFEILVFDDGGPGGSPGTQLGAVPAIVGQVPPWLDHTFTSVDIRNAVVNVHEGSVFLGVGWDESSEIGFYVAADESVLTDPQNGYLSEDGSSWSSISTAFPAYRSLMIRADGFSPVDGEWEQKVGSIFGGGGGFGDPSNTAANAMTSFGDALFVGTGNEFGAEVISTTDGDSWFLVNQPGFDDPTNVAISGMIEFNGFLYASTRNPVFGTQIWRSATASTWTYVDGDGFGDPSNASAPSSAVFAGNLYFGTEHASGCEIWRTPDGAAWTQVHSNGFGSSPNESAESMAIFNGELHVGTRNLGGAELWKSPDGIVWFPVVTGGFGSSANVALADLTIFNGVLYAGVSNPLTGAQLWRSTNGANWQQMVGDGFGNTANSEFNGFGIGDLGLIASVSGPSSSGSLWQSPDGSIWSAASSPGFSNPDNEAVVVLHYWGDRVFAGTSNPTDGCEIWRGGRHPLFENGFELGDTSGWAGVAP